MLRFCVALAAVMALALSIPARAEPPPVEAYGKLPTVEQISLSPSGQRYAFVAVIGEARKLVASSSDGQTILFSGDVGTAKVVSVSWAGEDHLLVSISHSHSLSVEYSVGKEEIRTVLVINIKTQKMFVLFKGSATVLPYALGAYGQGELDGHWYGYFGGATYSQSSDGPYLAHGYSDLYRVDLDTGAEKRIAQGSRDLYDWVIEPNGKVLARVERKHRTEDWQVFTGAFGGHVLASGSSKFSAVALARGRSADTILLELPADQGAEFKELSLAGDEDQFAKAPIVTDEPILDPATGLWVGNLKRGDQLEPTFFDAQAEARARGTMKAFPGLSVSLRSFTADLSRMIVETSGAGDSGTFWLVDIATGDAKPIGEAYPLVKQADVGPIVMVDWKAADGLALSGVLNLPPGRPAKNLPVIVMPHGGPEDRDYPTFWWWSQLFASRGYAVFQPNFRGSSGYGTAFRDAGFGQWGRKMQTDISDGLASLVEQGIVDPKRACIVGWSYGGYAAEAGVTLQHGLYRCAVSMAGVSDLGGMLNYARDRSGDEISDAERYWKAFWGVTSMADGRLKAISPAKQADQADAPILLIHGKDDVVVPIEQSLEMQRALKAADKPVELVTLPNADHWLLHEDTRLAMAKASLAFVLKYNPPDPEPVGLAAAKP